MQGWRVSQSPGFPAHRDRPAVVRLPSPGKGGKQRLVSSLPILTSWGRLRQLLSLLGRAFPALGPPVGAYGKIA